MIFCATNRSFVPGEFKNDRNPGGVSWWHCPGKPLTNATFWTWDHKELVLDAIKQAGKPVVLFIHGFNESFERDMGIMQSAVDYLGNDATPVAFSWDSLGSVFAYEQDRGRAAKSADDLMQVLVNLDQPSVIAHSMGNYVLQEALNQARGSAELYVKHAVMVAADTDFNCLDTSNIPHACQDGAVLHTLRDLALAGSNVLHGIPRLGFTGPLQFCPKNFKSIDCSKHLGLFPPMGIEIHGRYFTSSVCWAIMRNALGMGSAQGVAA